MADVMIFRSRAELSAAENLQAFVTMCRNQLTAFGANLQFDENVWDVTDALGIKVKGGAVRAVFSTWSTADCAPPTMMTEPFSSFAKAYFRYQHGTRPTKSVGGRLAALRALEHALTENGEQNDPCRIHGGILDRAAQLSKDRFSADVAYRVGGQLEMVAKFSSDHGLSALPFKWRNPLKRPIDDRERVGDEFDRRRQRKLPSAKALEALATAFGIAEEPADVVVCSIAAILCSAPERISEVLELRLDCEVDRQHEDKIVYGLRWWPAKGADPQVKWLIPSMADVARRAVSNIREHTEQARKIARWYEQHPDSLYLPPDLEYLRACEWLTLEEVGEVLFAEPAGSSTARNWCKRHNVTLAKRGGLLTASFVGLEKAVLGMLPRGFPFLSRELHLRFSEALCVVRVGELHRQKGTYRCLIEALSYSMIQCRLRSHSEGNVGSLFDRLGFSEADGSPIRITTHQFRHYLNTLAQAGGMSQLDIAKWSGRKEIRQNAVYDHVSDATMIQTLRNAVGDARRMHGPLARLPERSPIPRDEFARLAIPAVHTTEVGFCVHDFAMSPCRLHRDCFHCSELVCVKGDVAKEQAIRRQYEETRSLLNQALQAEKMQRAGASRWVEHQRETLERLEQLLTILNDPTVPEGSFIQLARPKTSPALFATSRPSLSQEN